jgi:transposase InsO family protein
MAVGAAIEEVLELEHTDLKGKSRQLSERTIYRWWEAFKKGGIETLERQQRNRIDDSQVLSEAMLSYLKAQKQLDPLASIPEIIRRAEKAGVIAGGEVNRVGVWRACKRLGLPVLRPRQRADRDMRRYAYPHRMMMVLADGKHFRAGSARAKRVALAILDDSTRYGLGIKVTTSETAEAFLVALSTVIRADGLMVSLFLDRGPGFISLDTHTVAARLGIHLIHGEKAYPEGHGKIERFNRTFKDQVLRGLDGNPAVDPDPAALTLRLNHWLGDYNKTPHEGIGGETPRARWRSDERELEFPPDGWLRHFVITCKRTVTNDNVISIDGVHYEVPRGSAGRRIEVGRHLLKGNQLTVLHKGEDVRLHPVDLAANARSRRARPRTPADTFSTPPQTAAASSFDADMKPLVDADGGYKKGPEDE